MTIKVYVSGICGSMEVRKQQQRVLFILQGLPIELQVIDITEPGREEERNFMQEECKKHDKKEPLPPQIFNENEYCGDYTDFQLANDDDIVMRFLKLEDETKDEAAPITQNGLGSHNDADDKETKEESKDEAAQEAGEKIAKSNEGIGVIDKSSTNKIAETVPSKNATKEEEEEEEESSEEESSEEEESEEEN